MPKDSSKPSSKRGSGESNGEAAKPKRKSASKRKPSADPAPEQPEQAGDADPAPPAEAAPEGSAGEEEGAGEESPPPEADKKDSDAKEDPGAGEEEASTEAEKSGKSGSGGAGDGGAGGSGDSPPEGDAEEADKSGGAGEDKKEEPASPPPKKSGGGGFCACCCFWKKKPPPEENDGPDEGDGEDPLGWYEVTRDDVDVSRAFDNCASKERSLASLNEGSRVEVVEVKRSSQCVRARLQAPAGWISLRALDGGCRKAKPIAGPDGGDIGGAAGSKDPPEEEPKGKSKWGNVRSASCVSRGLPRGGKAAAAGAGVGLLAGGAAAGAATGRLSRKPKSDKAPKKQHASSTRPPGQKKIKKHGENTRWAFSEREGYVITVAKSNEVPPIEVETKEEAMDMVRMKPEEYFGCCWVNKPYKGKPKVYPRNCKFFGPGFSESPAKKEAFGAFKAEYQALPANAPVRPDKYTDDLLSNYGTMTLVPKSPGRQQGLCDSPGLKLFGDLDPSDIHQGKVGDCWLLSAISALAEFDGSIQKLFKPNGDIDALPADNFNVYKVRLYDLKEWKPVNVEVDERLIFIEENNDVLGCKPTEDNELWPCVLEKAIAAHCGGWAKIDGGESTHAWRLMLGCREVYIIQPGHTGDGKFHCYGTYNPDEERWEELANSPHEGFTSVWPSSWPEVGGGGEIDVGFDEEGLFEKMCAWDDNNYIMCAGTKDGSDTAKTDGIVDGHSYTIIECIDNAGGTDFDMIKVRNPWGNSEFDCGGWGDDGPMFEKFPQVKEVCNPVVADDGIFWMERRDFFKYFKTIYLCACDMKAWVEKEDDE